MKILEVSNGIPHIEDLPIAEFLEVVSNLPNFQITEKVDGSQILFGIDEQGFYTSRETKGGKRIYNEEDYGITFSSTYMRSTHKLLEQVLPLLKGAGLRPGDQVEAEVLYGELPNVVPYSADTNYLIFLRTTEGTVNIDRLKQKLDGQSVSVSLVSPFTSNGKTIELREDINTWKFARVPVIENKLPKAKNIQIEKFLSTKDIFSGQSYRVILETPLNKIPNWVKPGTWKTVKEYIKEHKEVIQQLLLDNHVLPLKETLLNKLVRNTSSAFGPTISEGGWIEGVVLRHVDTGRMVKLVDKDVFGSIREQAWAHRNKLTESAKSIDGNHSFLAGIYVAMATALGHPTLGTMQAKNYLRKSGKITEEIVTNLSADINFIEVRDYWLGLLEYKENQLQEELSKYEKETSNISENVQRQLGDAVKKRTLETFAQTFQKMYELKEATIQTKCAADLITILVGKQLSEI